MAQAARLNLRMQKELKLLLTDPPHGASFPHLSPDSEPSSSSSSSSSFSLSTIHAQIKGPEGSVYEKGLFDIKIQIPERYPFQPPSVTFATPIYHPNIDNGGRICLDILNLPPKGAWQPSLNISTVITSIGLLLSEPNPDDGLMCEASREYKYNRQAFDQKARAMTEKFAMAGAGGNCLSMETNSNPSTMDVREIAKSKVDVDEHSVDHKKLSGNRRKLSLESSVSNQKRDSDAEVNEVPTHHLMFADSRNAVEVDDRGPESKGGLLDCNSRYDLPNRTKRRLSLESLSQQQKRDCSNLDIAEEYHCPLLASTSSRNKHLDQDRKSIRGERSMGSEKLSQVTEEQPLGSLEAFVGSNLNESQGPSSVPQAVDHHDEPDPQKGFIDKMENVSTNMKYKKPCLTGKKLSLGNKGSLKSTAKDEKENVMPARKSPPRSIQSTSTKPFYVQKPSAGPMTQLQGGYHEKQQCNENQDGNIKQQVTEGSPLSETVIVLDSEDSEEEANTPVRTKLSLAQRRLGKWKAKA